MKCYKPFVNYLIVALKQSLYWVKHGAGVSCASSTGGVPGLHAGVFWGCPAAACGGFPGLPGGCMQDWELDRFIDFVGFVGDLSVDGGADCVSYLRDRCPALMKNSGHPRLGLLPALLYGSCMAGNS